MKGPSLLAILLALLLRSTQSNGQECYYDVGKEANPEWNAMNCSSVDLGGFVRPCCFAGSVCLEQNACWDQQSGVTYEFGCTDPNYNHTSCPKKCGFNTTASPWVGLVKDGCGTNEKSWACNHPDSCDSKCPMVEVPWDTPPFNLPAVDCSDLKTQVIEISTHVGSILTAVVSLPSAGAPTSTSTPPAESSGMSSQAKVGIGLGVGLGVIALIIILVVTLLYLRRRKQQNSSDAAPSTPAPPYTDPVAATNTHNQYHADAKHGACAPDASTNFKAELPAVAAGNHVVGSPRSELHAESAFPTMSSPVSPGGEILHSPAVELPAGGWNEKQKTHGK